MGHRLRQLGSFGRVGIRGQPWGWKGIGGAAGAIPCPVVDSLIDADLTLLSGHTPDISPGFPWVDPTSTWEIVSNRLRDTGAGPPRVATIDSTLADCVIGSTFQPIGPMPASDPGLVARFTDASNYYVLIVNSIINDFQLWRQVAGVFSLLDNAATVFGLGDTIQFRVNGTLLEGLRGGSVIVSAVDASHQVQTKHGFFGNAAASAAIRWEDFSVCRL